MTRPHRVPLCEVCKTLGSEERREAIWAMQFIDGGAKRPTFTTLGSHYRGTRMRKVCDDCKQFISAPYDRVPA